jgi:hypothetical protein
MAKRLLTYRCLIISPSDVPEERDAVEEIVQQWNASAGRHLDVRVEAVRWETHAAPEMGRHPQEILDRQVVEDCDLAVAIFWTRLGSATPDHASGSVAEIERLLKKGARVMVYFSEKPLPSDVDLEQVRRLRELRQRYQSEGILGSFHSTDKLRQIVSAHLTMTLGELAGKERSDGESSRLGLATAPTPDVRVQARIVHAVVPIAVQRAPDPPRATYVEIRVENHSPSPVFITGISFWLGGDRFVLSAKDSMKRPATEKRRVETGDSTEYHYAPTHIRKMVGADALAGVVAHDAIGRRFRFDGDLAALLAEAERAHEVREDAGTDAAAVAADPARLTMKEQWDAMNYTAERVTFTTDNRGKEPQSFILFGGERYPESDFITPVQLVVGEAAVGERRFFEVMTGARKILHYVWDVMQKNPARAAEWGPRWLPAAEQFAALEEKWGERPNRYWR